MNNLVKLIDYGQSYWLDNLTREKIKNGEIKKRVQKQGLRGITSNPSIFNKAISGGDAYDTQIKKLVKAKKSVREIYEELTVKDVQDACDILKSVYDESSGTDGFVSLEVSPYLARDAKGTLKEARRLFSKVNRPNCLIKIPGTEEGVPAIEQCLYEGININITLLFSIKSYEKVAWAYINALERRLKEGKDISKVSSVASFFLSRIDVLTDKILGHYIIPKKMIGEPKPENLLGKAGIASAKIAYQSFINIFNNERWRKLENKGAHVQKPLWASTSTKDPLYSDVRYVEDLVGPHTVNTMPDDTIDAFADHGKIAENAVEQDVDKAFKVFEDLKKLNIDIDFITRQLVNEGIEKFINPYDNLMKTLALKRVQFLEDAAGSQEFFLGDISSEVKSAFNSVDEKQIIRRIFIKDPYVWKSDGRDVDEIKNALGWLNVQDFIDRSDEIIDFSKKIVTEKYKHVVLLGMGGSSLSSEVISETFGKRSGYPELIVLDNVDPKAIKNVESQIDLEKTLFIVASKSGKTIETLSFYKYFFNLLSESGMKNPGKNFVAITDDGTSLENEAKEKKFRQVFTNPGDYGGRYSVLSYFGLVPMALTGIDIKKILHSANQMEINSGPFIPAEANSAVSLGVTLGISARLGRDKLTLIFSETLKPFGYWVEQLIAESTGKEGKGILPVEGEELTTPEKYGDDRLFVYVHLNGDNYQSDEKKFNALQNAGHPIVKIKLKDKMALGAEFFRWELATAVAGRILDINPFNQPNVAESKKNSSELLDKWKNNRKIDWGKPIVRKNISVYFNTEADWVPKRNNMADFLKSFTELAESPDYLAIQAFFNQTKQREKFLQSIRINLRDKLKVATTVGYGPRYLHSTGQLHKGGKNNGVFIMFTHNNDNELPIPGNEYDFSTLQMAEALGDYRSLNNKKRRIIRIHLKENIDQGLKEISEILK